MLVMLSFLLLFTGIPAITVLADDDLSTEEKYRYLVKEGIFTGFVDGSSHLDATMTREQFAAVLFRLWELPEQTANPAYSDVLKTRWSFKEIQAVTKAGLMKGTGNGNFSPAANVTAEQLAVVLVRGYGLSGSASAKVYGKVSEWAKKEVGVALNKGWIKEQSDYRVNALRSQLVHASYSVYIDLNPSKNPEQEELDVRSVKSIANNSVQVDLRTAARSVAKNQFELEDEDGESVTIIRASLSDDGKRVTLTTDKQSSGKTYTLFIEGEDWSYKVISSDSTKPKVTSHKIMSDAKIEIGFSESVTASSAENKANYSFNNDLSIKSITLSEDKKKVTITTGKQEAGTVYTLTIKGIKDLAGNVMDKRSDLYFGSVVDKTAPTVSKIVLEANTIMLTFNEALDRSTGENEENYGLDGGLGHPQKAVYDEGNKTVALTTADQTPGSIYKLTLNGIKDKAGNLIAANTTFSFAGAGDDEVAPIILQQIDPINENMLELHFNRSLAAVPLSELKVAIVSDNGSSLSTSGWSSYFTLKTSDDKAIRIQFRTKDDGNPALFKQGHVYTAMVTGLSGLQTSSNANSKRFAGINEPNGSPYVTKADAVNKTSITVQFSEPVKNVSIASFHLIDDEGQTIKIASDQLKDKNKIITQLALNLDDELKAGKTYHLSFSKGITDAPGWNGLITQDGSGQKIITFQGTDQDNTAPRIKTVTAKDSHTFEIDFSEPVTGADQAVYTLYNETDQTQVMIRKGTHASYTLSEDRQKVTVSFHVGADDPLHSDKSYKLTYDSGSSLITDLQGKPLDYDEGKQFQGSSRDNARPAISAVEGWSSVLFITLSESVTGNPANAFELLANGKKVTPTSAVLQSRIVTLRHPSITNGTVVSVKFSAQGAESLLDYNKQKPIVNTIFYTVQ